MLDIRNVCNLSGSPSPESQCMTQLQQHVSNLCFTLAPDLPIRMAVPTRKE
jgi:hypothetical protein